MTEETLFFDGYHAGLFYELSADGKRYTIYEYTPVLHEKCIVASGISVKKGKYDEEFVVNTIDDLLLKYGIYTNTVKDEEQKYEQLKLPLQEVM